MPNKISRIQNIPVADSPNNEAFEAIVELYFQLQGYVTSSGKWFWYWAEGKKQRGYQDIDVLAINGQETVIVSVTSNLDDKIRFDRLGNVKTEMLNHLIEHFLRVEQYLTEVPEYNWLCAPDVREIRRVVACTTYYKNQIERIHDIFVEHDISLLIAKDIINFVSDYLDNNSNLKIQDQMLRMFRLLTWHLDK